MTVYPEGLEAKYNRLVVYNCQKEFFDYLAS